MLLLLISPFQFPAIPFAPEQPVTEDGGSGCGKAQVDQVVFLNTKQTFQRGLLSPLLAAARSATDAGRPGFCGLQSTYTGRQLSTKTTLMRKGSRKKVLVQRGKCYVT